MTQKVYISSFYKNIQKQFHTKDERKSRLVRTYEYFDRANKNGTSTGTIGGHSEPKRRASLYSSKEPQIRKITKDTNQMTISLDTGKRSELLNRRQSVPERLSGHHRRNQSSSRENQDNPHRTSRRSSEIHPQARHRLSLRQNTSSGDLRKNSTISNISNRNKIAEIAENKKTHKRDKKSIQSTEGSSRKSTKNDDIAEESEETEETYTMDETDELYRRIESWVAIVDHHLSTGDFDKCVIQEDIDYKDDIPRPSTDPDYHPGNHHTVTIVQYDDS